MENFIFCALILIQKGCIYPIRAASRPGVNEIQNSFDKHWWRHICQIRSFLKGVIAFLPWFNNLKNNVMRYAIWYHLYNLKNVKTPMEECYFAGFWLQLY